MVLVSNGLRFLQDSAGRRCRFLFFNQSLGSVWDSDATYTISGTALWLDALEIGLDPKHNEDAVLLEQGKIGERYTKLFINGSVTIQTGSTTVRIQIGSPTGDNFSVLDNIKPAHWGTSEVYKNIYCKYLTTGSLLGE